MSDQMPPGQGVPGYYGPTLGVEKVYPEVVQPSQSCTSEIGEGQTVASGEHHHNLIIPIIDFEPTDDLLVAAGFSRDDLLDGCMVYYEAPIT